MAAAPLLYRGHMVGYCEQAAAAFVLDVGRALTRAHWLSTQL